MGWVGTGYSPPSHPPDTPTPGTPSPPALHRTVMVRSEVRSIVAVGLKSVDQLTLSVLFSGLQGITEGYNLSVAGRINNHSLIPGTE